MSLSRPSLFLSPKTATKVLFGSRVTATPRDLVHQICTESYGGTSADTTFPRKFCFRMQRFARRSESHIIRQFTGFWAALRLSKIPPSEPRVAGSNPAGCTLFNLRNWPYRPVRSSRVLLRPSWPVIKRRVWGVFQFPVICPGTLLRNWLPQIRMSCVRLNGFFSANYRALGSHSGCLLPRRLLSTHRTRRLMFCLS